MTVRWSLEQLDELARAEEIDVAAEHVAGAPSRYTTIWIVGVADELYVRSYRGPNGSWYRAAARTGQGRIRVRGTEHAVRVGPAKDLDRTTADAAYRAKYGRSSYVDTMVTDSAAATTLRVVPR